MKTTIRQLTSYLEGIAPLDYQEPYDNAGLIYGNPDVEITGVLCSLDCTIKVVEEAHDLGCNVIVSHHPLVFGGIKKINMDHWVSQTLVEAIKRNIAIYAIHTNLDNVLFQGVNSKIAHLIGLKNTEILSLGKYNSEITIWISDLLYENVLSKLNHNLSTKYSVSYSVKNAERNQKDGKEVSMYGHSRLLQEILDSMQEFSPYVLNVKMNLPSPQVGAGMIGNMHYPIPEKQFMDMLIKKFHTPCVRHTKLLNKSVGKVAICGGAGRFLLEKAIRAGADAFVTGDFKYHDFFEANGQIVVADIGHYESEQFTIQLLVDIITEKFTTFASHYTNVKTNPVFYYGNK